jgi:hypothetical protein
MEKNHVEEIDLDLETGEILEVIKKSLPDFFLDDFPFPKKNILML